MYIVMTTNNEDFEMLPILITNDHDVAHNKVKDLRKADEGTNFATEYIWICDEDLYEYRKRSSQLGQVSLKPHIHY